MKKTFNCGQVIEVVFNTSIEVEGNTEQECNEMMIQFIKENGGSFINNQSSTNGISVFELGMDDDSMYGTDKIYLTDDEGVEVVS